MLFISCFVLLPCVCYHHCIRKQVYMLKPWLLLLVNAIAFFEKVKIYVNTPDAHS